MPFHSVATRRVRHLATQQRISLQAETATGKQGFTQTQPNANLVAANSGAPGIPHDARVSAKNSTGGSNGAGFGPRKLLVIGGLVAVAYLVMRNQS